MTAVSGAEPGHAAGAGTASDPAAKVATPPGGTRSEPGERGRLHVADRVVERVAGYAVTLIPDAAAAPRRVLGRSMGQRDADDEAKIRADVHGGSATVHATIAVRWPASVRAVTQAVRNRIREDLTLITNVKVDHVDIDVVSLPADITHARRVQ